MSISFEAIQMLLYSLKWTFSIKLTFSIQTVQSLSCNFFTLPAHLCELGGSDFMYPLEMTVGPVR